MIQVSDRHLSQSHSRFTGNWPVFVDAMRDGWPDFIAKSGDISFDGPANAAPPF